MKGERKLTKGRAVFIIMACAALLAAIVLICSGPSGSSLDTAEERAEYLASLGWKADPESEQHRAVVLPEEFSGSIAQYNALQKQQGFDLERYAGEEVDSWSYDLAEYPGGEENVTAQLYTYKGAVIGGDIHSNALGGFMHGLK